MFSERSRRPHNGAMYTARLGRHGQARPGASAFGRRGGLTNSPKQRQARAANARKGGRPPRVCVFCGEPVVGGHADRDLDDSCGAHGWRWKHKSDPPEASREALEAELAAHEAAVKEIAAMLRPKSTTLRGWARLSRQR